MDLDTSLESGDITVTYVDISKEERERDKLQIQQQQHATEEGESPQRHDTNLYKSVFERSFL